MRARGFSPSVEALRALVTMTAAPASFMPLALPAATGPRLLRPRLGAAGNVRVADARRQRERRLPDGREARCARADHRDRGCLAWDPRAEPDVPAGVTAAADRLAEDHVVVVGGVDAGALHRFADGRFSKRPGRYGGELAAYAADGCADRGEDDGVVSWHAVTLAPGRLRAPEGPRPAHPFALCFERQHLLGFVP